MPALGFIVVQLSERENMKLQVVAVADRALQAFNRPICVQALGLAVRSFQDEVNNTSSELSKHPEDYELHHLGVFDDQTGAFESFRSTIVLVRGKDLVKGEA